MLPNVKYAKKIQYNLIQTKLIYNKKELKLIFSKYIQY